MHHQTDQENSVISGMRRMNVGEDQNMFNMSSLYRGMNMNSIQQEQEQEEAIIRQTRNMSLLHQQHRPNHHPVQQSQMNVINQALSGIHLENQNTMEVNRK